MESQNTDPNTCGNLEMIKAPFKSVGGLAEEMDYLIKYYTTQVTSRKKVNLILTLLFTSKFQID